jgi:hypothetical protein
MPVERSKPAMHTRCAIRTLAMTAAVLAFAIGTGAQAAGVKDRTIGYVLTNKAWAVYQTPDGKVECPNGFNDGPREQFAKLYPENGKPRELADTQLDREADIWFPRAKEPSTDKGALPFNEVAGKIAIGLNLDDKVGANDFTGPHGEKGIDNQLYRAIGCIAGFRGPDGSNYFFENDYMQRYIFNRILIEITDVDDLMNDDDVTVTTYRGLDPLLTSANGKDFIAGETQRIDEHWGKRYIHRAKGKIVNGVLTTDPIDLKLPWAMTFDTNPDQSFKAARFQLKLTPTGAEGLLGAYVDVKDWAHRLTINWSAHHASYGQISVPSLVRAMHRLADAYPDPATGQNTAISAAVEMKFAQAYILHNTAAPSKTVAAK